MSAVIMDANEAPEVLEQHVSTIQTCLETVSIDSPDDDIPNSKVSGQRAARYHKESDESGLGAAIEQLQKLLENTPEDHPEHLSYLWELGDAYYQRYEQSEVSSDIDEAIMLYQNALEMVTDIAENSQHRARMFTSLSDAYWLKMRDSQTMKILEVSIYWREKAVEAYQTLPDDTGPCKKQLRLLIDKGYFLRSEFTGSSIDLDKSIELCKRLLSLPGGHLERSEQLDRLGEIYDAKYNQTGAVTDYEMAIRFKEEALELISGDSVSREKRLASLSRSKWINSRKTLENVEESIRLLQATIAQTPNGHQDYQDHILELGRSLWLRYNETQAQADLEASIQQLTELSSTLIKKDATRVEAFRLLHEVYHARFLRTRSVSDIDLAIEWCHKTFHILPDEHRGRSKCLVDLATFWAAKYEQTKGKSDFDAAIHWSEHALGALPRNSYERAESLRSLGLIYYYRLGKTAAVSDADQCVMLFQKAVDLMTATDYRRPNHLYHLALAYNDRYRMTAAATDADASMQCYHEALDLAPDGDPQRAKYINGLFFTHESLWIKTDLVKYLEESIPNLNQVLDDPRYSAPDRLSSGTGLFRALTNLRDWPAAYQTAMKVMDLLPQITSRSLQSSDKQFQLGRLFNNDYSFASQAAAMALRARKTAYHAISLLELGRGIIIGSLGELRLDLSDLRKEHPLLAKRYLELGEQLDTSEVSNLSISKHDLAKKFDRLLEEIREQQNFERFLLPPNRNELQEAAMCGPVVIINAAYGRSDAFIIEAHWIRRLRLPLLLYDDVQARAEKFSTSTLHDAGLLEWLWDTIAEPILEFLDLTDTPDGGWPRIWWIPVGSLAKLPIHAAGYHFEGSGKTVLDRVMSSYSSSVKTLLQNRQAGPEAAPQDASNKAVLVGMETTPGQPSLHSVSHEINRVAMICEEMGIQPLRSLESREEVLSALMDCSVFHFAGHGRNNALDPSKTALLLRDGPLTVADLFDINLRSQRPFMAYLSACGTGQIRHNETMDEGLHLINAYQMAGFRHVIGSLCGVEDILCEQFAREIYQWIKDHGFSDRSVCEGLHHASRKLRDQWIAATYLVRGVKQERGGLIVSTDLQPGDFCDSPGNVDLREARTVLLCDDDVLPAHWAPYVHFGA